MNIIGQPVPGYVRLSPEARADLRTRLSYCYEPEKVAAILAGVDEDARLDLGRWRLLGVQCRR